MNIKNYTSEMPAVNSINQIERLLVNAGATRFSKEYSPSGHVSAIFFQLKVKDQPIIFQIPANVEKCYAVMWREIKKPLEGTEKRILAQAERTAWKIMLNWVEIQISLIQMEQVEPLQVFLAYVYDAQRMQTFYDKLKENNLKLLTN